MAIISFFTSSKEQTGNTLSAIALATYLGIEKNQKILYIATDLNSDTVKNAVWATQTKKKSGLFGPNTNVMSDNGIEGLDRVIRSNKISPDIITDYTKVALTGRLEFLLGYKGSDEQYEEIQKQYMQIVNMASKCYDTVIVDIDRKLKLKTQMELLKISDIVIAMTTQRISDISKLLYSMAEGTMITKRNTLITLGKYDEKSKYNAKNISRNVLKQKEIINTIPYNTVLFDSVQEGQIIDMFIKFLSLKIQDENTFFVDEIKRLTESIDKKIEDVRRMAK